MKNGLTPAPTTIPTGLQHSAQGWPRQRTTLGQWLKKISNPNGVASVLLRRWMQPIQGCVASLQAPRVARPSQPWADGCNPFGIGRSGALVGRVLVWLLLVALFQTASLHAAATVEQWGVYEITLPGPTNGNPFLEVRFAAKFALLFFSVIIPLFYFFFRSQYFIFSS